MRMLALVVGAVLLQVWSVAPARSQTVETEVFAVAYVDVAQARRADAVDLLRRYRDASRLQTGHVSTDLLEQVGRAAHFVVVERWRDQAAFDAHDASVATAALQSGLQPLRVSGYDRRPYKALSVAKAEEAGARTMYVVTHVDIGGPQANAPEMLRELAETSRQEAGCLRFDVLQHAMRANHFTVVEAWRDEQALEAHASASHTRTYRDRLQPMTGSPLDERVFTRID